MRDRNKLSDRQRNIIKYMEGYLESHGFPPTIREIGEATGIASTSVVNYNLNKLATAGYLTRSSRMSRGIKMVNKQQPVKNKNVIGIQSATQVSRVPMYGQIVASAPVPIPEDMGYPDEEVEVTSTMLNGADPAQVFALRVKGDSMIDAMIQDGDIVIFRKQVTANDGDMVAVWLDERGETTLKYFHPEGARIRLQPAHPTMQPIYVPADHCQVQGRVLSVLRQSV